ncbi:MAG: hypothetical protein ABIF18_01625 [archaeon]
MGDEKKKEEEKKKVKAYSFIDKSAEKQDINWAIKKTMTEAHKSGELETMGMWNFGDGKFKPVSSYRLGFDSQQNQLEPIYYWLLDWLGERGWDLKKIVDNFIASPGSGQFSEMNMKATKMQEEGMKILGGMNQVVKSVLNLIYDLKEFELRLEHYNDANDKESKQRREEGMLALKQIWLDNVDLKRGRGSIHQMAAELGFTTLREVFMMANSVDDVKKMNKDEEGGLINDQVMRILIPRISEFLKWVDYSEKELRKRFSIERNYLKSQVETIKLYSAWMKPYLVAAEKLRQKGFDNHAALVNAFSTSMFELQLFGQQSVSAKSVYSGNYDAKRKYNAVLIIGLEFRGHVSQRVTQKGDYGFAMGGKVNMTFDCYALNNEELAAAKKLLDDTDVEKSLEFSADIAGDALADLKEDLDYFLKSKEEREKLESKNKEEKKKSQDINPFAALFGLGDKKDKDKKKDKDDAVILAPEDIKKDNFVEKMMRAGAAKNAASWLYLAYDIYKKAHLMASAPGDGFDTHDAGAIENLSEGGNVGFTGAFKGKESNW